MNKMTWPPQDNACIRWQLGTYSIADLALCTAGLGYLDRPAGRRQAYLDLIAPHDAPDAQAAIGRLSGCALVALGWMRCFGLSDPELQRSYHIGKAVTQVVTIGLRHDVWSYEVDDIEVGDILLVAKPEHVCCVVGAGDKTSVTRIVDTIDGGQVDSSKSQCISQMQRYLGRKRGDMWLGDRRIVGRLRGSMLSPSSPQYAPIWIE